MPAQEIHLAQPILGISLACLAYSLYEENPKNHWVVCLKTKEPKTGKLKAVYLNMRNVAKKYGDPASLTLDWKDYPHERVLHYIPFDLSTEHGQFSCQDVVDLLLKNFLERFIYTNRGGCRYWCHFVIWDLEVAKLLKSGSTMGCLPDLKKHYPDGRPSAIDKGTFNLGGTGAVGALMVTNIEKRHGQVRYTLP